MQSPNHSLVPSSSQVVDALMYCIVLDEGISVSQISILVNRTQSDDQEDELRHILVVRKPDRAEGSSEVEKRESGDPLPFSEWSVISLLVSSFVRYVPQKDGSKFMLIKSP
jgi:hypothetical protein